jgi:serine/threonine protein kinase
MDLPGQAKLRGAWPETATGALRPGMALGRYELLVPVGVGGMACVWAARLSGYRGFSKLVAIKTVLPHLAGHRDFENMLLDEARIAADAHHPNVCNLFDVGEENGILYLVLEWVEGDSLLQVLRAGRASPPSRHAAIGYRVAARIVADACAGLHAAHELVDDHGIPLGVVHRDVSPHNLLVSIDGTTKLADFGVAKAQGQLHQATRAGEIRGKLAYMAPEQMNGSGLDRRADVFAMGGVLYHATTGQPPFRGDSDVRLIRAVLEGEYEPPERLAPDYPPELGAIVTRALTADVNRRFQTAEQMRSALEAWLSASGQPTTASDVGALVRQRIGARLEQRRQEVRAALEADRVSGSTRPVRAAAASPFDSATLRATGSAADAPSPASLDGAPIRLLPPASPAAFVSTPPPVLPLAAPARTGSLKMAGAVVLGLLTAMLVLSLRSVIDPRRSESTATAVPSVTPPAEPPAPEPLPASTGAPHPPVPGPAASAAPAAVPGARASIAAVTAPRGGPPLPSTGAPPVAARTSEPVAPRTAPPGRPPSFAGGGLALPANPY